MENLWEVIAEGRSCWTSVPRDRFNEEAFLHPNPDFRGGYNHRGGHFLSQNLAAFDGQFFGLSTAELKSMDPQQRLLLELSYEAFENGGLPMESLQGSDTAVFVAAFTHDYDRILSKDPDDIPKYYLTGVGEAILSNRISHCFDLRGPSVTLDTGCSGGLVALHQACQNLRMGESSMALVAGVNLMLTPDHMIGMSNFNMLNDQGRSFAFDDRGSGYGRGEGCAAVVLKRVGDALQCNDTVRSVIRSSGINQDGKTPGITKPSGEAQSKLAQGVLEKCGVQPQDVGYIEAHGTGTDVGDIAEMRSIITTYSHNRVDPLYVGSIKSNIGHLESVSGLAGLLKAALVIEKGCIPPQADLAHFKPGLGLHKFAVKIPRELVVWKHPQKRLVGVNSFGYGGTNAHVLLEQAPETVRCDKSATKANFRCKNEQLPGKAHLFTVSARSELSLKNQLTKLRNWAVSQESDEILTDLAFTLNTRRTAFDWRSSFVATSCVNLCQALDQTVRFGKIPRVLSKPKTIFLFTGQGAQWAGMGRELINPDSPFRTSLLKSETVLRTLGASWHLIEELQVGVDDSRISRSELAQPISTALQIALVDLLASFDIKPSIVVGHSSGEIAAAYAAGVLSQESALKVAYYRGFISATCRGVNRSNGAMLAVGLAADEIEHFIVQITSGKVLVACINSPSSTTVSGDEQGIHELQSLLDAKSIVNRRLKVDTAYHSHHMHAASESYKGSLKDLSVDVAGSVKFISTVTGTIKVSDFGADYWVSNLLTTVRYRQAIQDLLRMETQMTAVTATSPIFVEIGPHEVLVPLTRDIVGKDCPKLGCRYTSTLVRNVGAIHTILDSAGRLFEAGLQIDLGKIISLTANEGPMTCISSLPPYSWDHSKTYWHESRLSREYRFSKYPHHDLLGVRIASSTPIEPRWRNLVSIESHPWLEDHKINGKVVYPGSAYICMAIEAIRQIRVEVQKRAGVLTYVLKDVSFSNVLMFQERSKKTEMQVSLSPPSKAQEPLGDPWLGFRITATDAEGAWAEHCSGLVGILSDDRDRATTKEKTRTIYEAQSLHTSRPSQERGKLLMADQFYYSLDQSGNSYGPTFAIVKEMLIDSPDRATASIESLDVSRIMPYSFTQPCVVHPTTLDALMHTSIPLFQEQKGKGAVMPVSVGELRISSQMDTKPGTELLVSTEIRSAGPKDGVVQLSATSSAQLAPQEAALQVSNMRLRVFASAKKRAMDDKLPVWTTIWEPMADLRKVADIKANESSLQRRIKLLRNTDFGGNGEHISQTFVSGLQRWANSVGRTSWDDLTPDKSSIYVVLDDGKRPMLANLTEQSFRRLTNLLSRETSMLWISLSTDPIANVNPEKSLMAGFARSAHAENDRLLLSTLDIQQPWETCGHQIIETVVGLLHRDFMMSYGSNRNRDREFVFRDGQVLRPRIVPAPGPTDWVLETATRPGGDDDMGLKLDGEETLPLLDCNATYVMAGGLGFIGRELCNLMARRGARHITVLSRRSLSATEKDSEISKLQASYPAISLYYFACDVSVPSDIEATRSSLAAMGVPPIKGVVQSATILNDQLLAKMTVRDFNEILQSKLHGTRNLSLAFDGDSLDFFISMSSCVAVVGTRGQANYAAGNAFQDAFAYGHVTSNAHYMSVSPALIQDAGVYDQVRERNLRLHGLVPVSVGQLMSLLEYSMTPQARQDDCKHALIGFTEESLAQVAIRNATVHSAMFSRILDTTIRNQSQSNIDNPVSFEERIKRTENPEQIKSVIVSAVVKKLAELTSAQDVDAMMHKPLEDLGLDSLLSNDLSNWTSSSFGTPFKPSELMEMKNASALADSIYNMSDAVQKIAKTFPNNAGKYHSSGLEIPDSPIRRQTSNGFGKAGLSALPLPDLEETLHVYRECLRCYRTSEELKVTSDACQEFLNEGFGYKLQDRLRARAEDPTIDCWQTDLYASNIYLKRRDPVHPFTIFYGGHILTQNPISQAKKAATIVVAAFDFRRQVLSGAVAEDELHGNVLCSESWAWLFNACREPDEHVDKMRKYPGNDYVVVLRRGHMFKLSWSDEDMAVSLSSLESAFERIIQLSQMWRLSAASLTADDRTSWAKIRQSLLAESSRNADTIQIVEAAAFVICLSDAAPETPSERCNTFFLGKPNNRWSDKNLQFVVCANGSSALIGEHSMLDGLSVRKLQQAVTAAILDNDKITEATALLAVDAEVALEKFPVEELTLVPDSASEQRISHIEEGFDKGFAPIELVHHEVCTFGNVFLRQYGCSPKSGYQLVIQLACLLYYGYQPPSWETVSTARFHKGRVDWIQTVTPSVSEFCSSVLDSTVSRVECRNLFFNAAVAHTNQVNKIARGHGFKAHLHALREMVDDQEPIPKLFRDPAWEATRVQSAKIVKTDCTEGLMLQETAFLTPTEACIFIHFEVEDDK
ncbi:MAG: hypothetical protein Q9201_001182 [Fulgogasparrea decipioides]